MSDVYKYLERQLKYYKGFEEKHIKFALNNIKNTEIRIIEELQGNLTAKGRKRLLKQQEDIKNLYSEINQDLKILQKKYTKEGLQLGLNDILDYGKVASGGDLFTGEVLNGVQGRVSKKALINIGENYYGYLGKYVEKAQRKTLASLPAIKAVAELPLNKIEEIHSKIFQSVSLGLSEDQLIRDILKNTLQDNHKVLYAPLKRHVHHTLSNVYNESRHQTIVELLEEDEEYQKTWVARLKNTTPICLGLHGQTVGANELFKWGGWEGKRPPATGSGAKPGWHICYSTIVADHPDWPKNKIIEQQKQAIKEGKINSGTQRQESVDIGKAKKKDSPAEKPKPKINQKKSIQKEKKPIIKEFIPAKTLKEAEEYAKINFNIEKVKFTGLPVETANEINKSVHTYNQKFPLELDEISTAKKTRRGMPDGYVMMHTTESSKGNFQGPSRKIVINKAYFSEIKQSNEWTKQAFEDNYWVCETTEDIMTHELGHHLSFMGLSFKELVKYDRKLKFIKIGEIISKYAGKDGNEAIAEGFVLYMKGKKLPDEIRKLLKKYLKGFVE